MSIPFQYENDNFIILFCENENELNKILKTISETEQIETKIVRCLRGKEFKWDICIDTIYSNLKFYQEYIDDMNEEVYIKKSSKIIYLYNNKYENIFKLNEIFNKPIYISVDGIFDEGVYKREWNSIHSIQFRDEDKNIKNENKIKKKVVVGEGGNEKREGINMITYIRRMEGNDLYYQLQIKCILENYKNKNIETMVVIGKKVEETFQKIQFEKIEGKKLILIDDDDDNITFEDMFIISNELFDKKIVMILRSDIIFLQMADSETLYFDFLLNEKKVYCLNKIERDLSGRFVRGQYQNTVFGGIEQDGWIYRAPIECKDKLDIENIKNYDFNERYSELYMNSYLEKHGYELINDITNYKILRLMVNPDMNQRDLLKEPKKIEEKKMMMVPEYSIMENFSIEQMLQMIRFDEMSLYNLKKEIINKYIKPFLFQ